MKAVTILLCLVLFNFVQAKPASVQLSKEEEECIAQTGIARQLVIQDKVPEGPRPSAVDSAFNEYLGCYRHKLLQGKKMSEAKKTFVRLPGYKTPYKMKSLWCGEDGGHVLGLEYPCVEREPPLYY